MAELVLYGVPLRIPGTRFLRPVCSDGTVAPSGQAVGNRYSTRRFSIFNWRFNTMKLVSFESKKGPTIGAVVWSNNEEWIVDLPSVDPAIPRCMKDFLAGGESALAAARNALDVAKQESVYPYGTVLNFSVVPDPSKILCVGLNYADHAAEFGDPIPDVPVIFNKCTNALIGDGDPIVVPRVSKKVDYEAELVIVIGKRGRYISPDEAIGFVAGYCCGNDVSARDWQLERPGKQWFIGKTFDTFAPVGPWLVTKDEVENPNALGIKLRLNGQTMQNSNTSNFIFTVPKVVSYVSQVMTLNPGDLIFTGTPPGVGGGRKPPIFMKPGDVVEVEIDKIGTLRNPVRGE